MKSLITFAVVTLAATALIAADVADARRLGGGRSLGMQRQGAAPAPATPAPSASSVAPGGAASNPVMPASPATAAAARPAAPAATPSGASRWLGPIAGLAAGIGLAALLSHFGLSESVASFLLLALIVFAVIAVARRLLMRRAPQASPMRYATIGGVSSMHGASQRFQPANEISAADAPIKFEPAWGGGARQTRRMPVDFNPAPFLEQAKLQFRRLQEAHDKGDRDAIANVTTPAMYRELANDIDARRSQIPTEIVGLDADVLEVVQEGSRYVASIRFKGQLREDGATEPASFVEIWNLEKPVSGTSGWLLAGIQQVEAVA